MGKRDYRRREPKKAKKDAKRTEAVSELLPAPEVEVVGKKKISKTKAHEREGE